MQIHLHVREVPDPAQLALLLEIRTMLGEFRDELARLRHQGETLMTVASDVLVLCQRVDAATSGLAAAVMTVTGGVGEVGRDLAALRARIDELLAASAEGTIDAVAALEIKGQLESSVGRLEQVSTALTAQAAALEQLGRDPENPVPPPPENTELPPAESSGT